MTEILQNETSHGCIMDHPNFGVVCLDPEVLQTALVAVRDVRFEDFEVPVPNQISRLAAYRQFTWWIHTRLGHSIRRVIPACAVYQIRQGYPEELGQYVGFQQAEED